MFVFVCMTECEGLGWGGECGQAAEGKSCRSVDAYAVRASDGVNTRRGCKVSTDYWQRCHGRRHRSTEILTASRGFWVAQPIWCKCWWCL